VLLVFNGQGARKEISLHTAETAMPPFLLQGPISKGQWYQLFNPFFEFCKLIRLRLTLAGFPAAVFLRLSFNSVESPFLGSKNGTFCRNTWGSKKLFLGLLFLMILC